MSLLYKKASLLAPGIDLERPMSSVHLPTVTWNSGSSRGYLERTGSCRFFNDNCGTISRKLSKTYGKELYALLQKPSGCCQIDGVCEIWRWTFGKNAFKSFQPRTLYSSNLCDTNILSKTCHALSGEIRARKKKCRYMLISLLRDQCFQFRSVSNFKNEKCKVKELTFANIMLLRHFNDGNLNCSHWPSSAWTNPSHYGF